MDENNQYWLYKFKAVTGLKEVDVLNEMAKISCSYSNALEFYKIELRFPTMAECNLMGKFEYFTGLSLIPLIPKLINTETNSPNSWKGYEVKIKGDGPQVKRFYKG